MIIDGKIYIDREQFISYITITKQKDMIQTTNIKNYKEQLIELEMADNTCLMGYRIYLTVDNIPISYMIFQNDMYYEFDLKCLRFN
jgi:hypothetical protein